MAAPRSARLKAFAKLNLDLKVLNRGADGFHELRSVFQTVSLADTLAITYTPSRTTALILDDAAGIADNLVVRAARRLLDHVQGTGRIEMRLRKQIPMGAGMGGGSSDAAAVLLALPVLAGWRIPLEELARIGAELGSDVPFFLLGGAAVALGRGTELYPLPDLPARPVLVAAPPLHVSTPEAYRALDRGGNGKLTEAQRVQYIDSFQSRVWRLGDSLSSGAIGSQVENDFEGVVFPQHPQLKSILKNLQKSGADPARMTGSGSALFGVFTTQSQVRQAQAACETLRPKPAVFPASFLSRNRYRAAWRRQLQEHMDGIKDGKQWPPQSRYALRRRNEQ
ncbi:MAG TPA: 4-(cytidine 5'-diphospho)-2-C-methyl-D-erythritol kinase [Bryobacteraceae bacterium]|nr:4-(cytidine 5'-diphospho)-2-C-methyl-D-erythritol kinase [Bryobacteraceae bacterium]